MLPNWLSNASYPEGAPWKGPCIVCVGSSRCQGPDWWVIVLNILLSRSEAYSYSNGSGQYLSDSRSMVLVASSLEVTLFGLGACWYLPVTRGARWSATSGLLPTDWSWCRKPA